MKATGLSKLKQKLGTSPAPQHGTSSNSPSSASDDPFESRVSLSDIVDLTRSTMDPRLTVEQVYEKDITAHLKRLGVTELPARQEVEGGTWFRWYVFHLSNSVCVAYRFIDKELGPELMHWAPGYEIGAPTPPQASNSGKPKEGGAGKNRMRRFSLSEDGISVMVVCSICDTFALLSNPMPVAPNEDDLIAQTMQFNNEDGRKVLRAQNMLPDWYIPMTYGEGIECSLCREPDY